MLIVKLNNINLKNKIFDFLLKYEPIVSILHYTRRRRGVSDRPAAAMKEIPN